MSEQESNKATIIGIIPHVLSFIACELCKYGFLLAYERGLSDLKDLIEPDSISEADIDLLDTVDDDVVRYIVKSIDSTLSCMKTFMLINNLDEFEVMEDDEFNQLASNIYHIYMIDWENKNYEQTLANLHTVYFCLQIFIYHTIKMIVENDVDAEFVEYERFFDILSEIVKSEQADDDKNIDLLNGLIVTLNDDLLKIDKV